MELERRRGRWRRLVGFALLAVVSFLVGSLVTTVVDMRLAAQSPAPQASTANLPQAVAVEAPGIGNPYILADIAEQVSPAVVFVSATFPQTPQVTRDPFFEFFFGQIPAPEQSSAGTGFIISEDGYILTNQHVVGNVGDNQKITVKISTPDFTGEVPAQLMGTSYSLDLAVLKIDKPRGLARLPVVKLGDSDRTRPGEWVIAIGNPYGEQLEHTVTVGVVSAKGRQIRVYDRDAGRWRQYQNLLQTDAAINPGNSGGPLVNIAGEVIGINTAVNAQGQNIGFAIPINEAKQVLEGLIAQAGQPQRRPYMGVLLEDIDSRLARYLGLPDTNGALISTVVSGSPADKAGLRVYDVIRRMGQREIKTADDVITELDRYKPGDEVLLQVFRNGRTVTVVLTLGERPANS
ncbi:S1C family serine protease [Geochorda subterranea]|uniref:Trypsin-like peptidase domain-containing protein n=1 Tax=Geochorda subterranea TaxID=3109564 RepID=A0ABZ1BPM5_9FIRM|nr:trypsin-like peptidase domain-containing protein [Limnochorda sp. LNt]WRP14786.1 trypsin-like peptidase domain-containing protein [Limnochorda sp. LNt]